MNKEYLKTIWKQEEAAAQIPISLVPANLESYEIVLKILLH